MALVNPKVDLVISPLKYNCVYKNGSKELISQASFLQLIAARAIKLLSITEGKARNRSEICISNAGLAETWSLAMQTFVGASKSCSTTPRVKFFKVNTI